MIEFTAHAARALALRRLSQRSVEAILAQPAWTEPDPDRPGVERAFGRAPELGARWVRVAFRRTEDGDIVVITVHPDRGAQPPQA